MDQFLETWARSAMTSLGFFWMALWAFCLGYFISSMIQVFVTRERMNRSMGKPGARSVFLGAFFGFLSSSCSFAALSTTRALFQKGSGLVPALAFLLASTNLVIELGIVILIFLSWQFVVAEYVGGLLLILVMWLVVRLTLPKGLEQQAREHARRAGGEGHDHDHEHDHETHDHKHEAHGHEGHHAQHGDDNAHAQAEASHHKHQASEKDDLPAMSERAGSVKGWRMVARRYFMEWAMVWKDVTFGFTIAGVIAAFVPAGVFQSLFVGSGGGDLSVLQIMLHTVIGPAAAFLTFIGSMGNIPLAGVLFASGVSFAGVMAFIFSDLVVFPVLRISASYFGWRMAAYILIVFLVCLVTVSLAVHFGFASLGLLPDASAAQARQIAPEERFAFDYTLVLNMVFALLTALGAAVVVIGRGKAGGQGHHHDHGGGSSWMQRVLLVLACLSGLWLVGGVGLWIAGAA